MCLDIAHHESVLVHLVRAQHVRQLVGEQEAVQRRLVEHVARAAPGVGREPLVGGQLQRQARCHLVGPATTRPEACRQAQVTGLRVSKCSDETRRLREMEVILVTIHTII